MEYLIVRNASSQSVMIVDLTSIKGKDVECRLYGFLITDKLTPYNKRKAKSAVNYFIAESDTPIKTGPYISTIKSRITRKNNLVIVKANGKHTDTPFESMPIPEKWFDEQVNNLKQ